MNLRPRQLTVGQTVFVVVCILAGSFLAFYLGARFGPEFFWGVEIDRISQRSLLPDTLTDAEIEALIKETGSSPVTFHQVLEGKASAPALTDSPPVPVSVTDPEPTVDTAVLKTEKKPGEKKPDVAAKVAKVSKELAKKEEPKKETAKPDVSAAVTNQIQGQSGGVGAALSPSRFYTLQVGSFSSEDDARALEAKLKVAGYPVFVQELTIPGKGNWYRVKVGKYTSRTLAEEEAGHLRQTRGMNPVVVEGKM